VTLLSGSGAVPTYRGPAALAAFGGRRGSVADGRSVTMYCAAYGQPVVARGTASRLWDYTSAGWVNDVYTHTGTTAPVVPACVGNIASPRLGYAKPTAAAGPFAVVTSGPGLAVRLAARPNAPAVAVLRTGDLVSLSCFVRSVTVAPPRGLSASSDNWDRIGSGRWIPDAYLYSASTTSVAPAC
jgi:hypothetical protein